MNAPLEHTVFGTLTFTPPDTWENRAFEFGVDRIQLLIQAGRDGPDESHVTRFREFEERYHDLAPRIYDAINTYRQATDQSRGSYTLSTVYLPDPSRLDDLSARLWFDDPAEEIIWFGVEIYGWERIVPFAED